MKRTLRISLCALWVAATCLFTLIAPPAGAEQVQADLAAESSESVPVVLQNNEPICVLPDGGSEPCATLYPKEYREWQDSVHGRAHLSGDSEAPGCTDCHDDPASPEIRTSAFRLDIPSRCARCHNDEERMRKHDVATDTYSSYLADFHGFTIDYYRSHDPSMWRYEAVCIDCHRSHAVYKASDPRSTIAPENLLVTCQKCHPDAESNYIAVTTGHFRVNRETSLLPYSVKVIYKFLIPTVIGLMAAYIALDIIHRLRERFAGKK